MADNVYKKLTRQLKKNQLHWKTDLNVSIWMLFFKILFRKFFIWFSLKRNFGSNFDSKFNQILLNGVHDLFIDLFNFHGNKSLSHNLTKLFMMGDLQSIKMSQKFSNI